MLNHIARNGLFLFLGLFVFELQSHAAKETVKIESSSIEVTPLNSPVKTDQASFLIKVPSGFEIDFAKYRIRNSIHIFDKSTKENPLKLSRQQDGYVANIDVAKLPPGQYMLYLKVKDKKGQKEIIAQQRKKHVLKDFTGFIIDESLQVKDPGEAGKKTLEGIDSDGDGLRDDVQRYINSSSYSEDVKQSLKNYGRLMQLVILNSKDPVKTLQSINEMVSSTDCTISHYGFTSQGLDRAVLALDEVKKNMLNTEERFIAYRLAQTHASGTGSTSRKDKSKEALCNF